MRPRFLLEYAAVRLIEALLAPCSWVAAQQIGAMVGGSTRFLSRRRWAMTLRNLELAFPEKTAPERRAIALESWRNAGRVATEFFKSRHLSREELDRVVSYENLDLVRAMYREGAGIVYNIGHMGNWEVGGIAFTAQGFPLAVVARTMKSPLAEAWVRETRSHFGTEVFSHRNPFFPAVKWLKKGKGVAVLIDHNLYEGGIFVPFFGRPAATSTLSALLAVKVGCPVLHTRVRREGARLIVCFEGPLRHDPKADPEQEVARLTAEMIKTLEGYVRERPEEWLWGHNRWKRQP